VKSTQAKGEKGGVISLSLSRSDLSARDFEIRAQKESHFFLLSPRRANVNAARRCLFPPRLSRREGKKGKERRERERELTGNEGAGGKHKERLDLFFFFFLVVVRLLATP